MLDGLQMCDLIKDCFVTGRWEAGEDAEQILARAKQDDEELYGDFEDLEKQLKSEGQAEGEEAEEPKSQIGQKKATTREERLKQIEAKRWALAFGFCVGFGAKI